MTATARARSAPAHVAVRVEADCPACGAAVVVRRRLADGETFLACAGYPRCRWTGAHHELEAAIAREVLALRADVDQLRAENEQLRVRPLRAVAVVDVARELRDVIAYAHPDRWRAAGELATGVTARLCALRDRLDERDGR